MTKIIKRQPSKICPCCLKRFFKKKSHVYGKQWEERIYCSGKCREQKIPTEQYKQKRLQEILSKTITTSTGCMEWQGCLYPGGYAQIRIFGKQESGSRVVWKLINGEIPDGLWVLHKCDNRKCINPEHLFLGTRMDNIKDMYNKERNYHKVTSKQKIEIIERVKEGISYAKIAKKFNFCPMTICIIANQNGIHRKKFVDQGWI